METITPRNAPKIKIWATDENRFIRPDHQCYMQECGTMIGGQSGDRKDHLHALRTAEIKGHTVTEYDVDNCGYFMVLWDGYRMRSLHLDTGAWTTAHDCFGGYSHDDSFNALERPEKLRQTIPREILDAHPLLAQAVARVNPNQSEIERIETEMRKLADDLEKLKDK